MKRMFFSFVVVSVVLLALFTISQLSMAEKRSEASRESDDEGGLRKIKHTQVQSSDNIWSQGGVNGIRQGTLNSSATNTPVEILLTQFVQQGPKLVGTGAVGKAEQGRPVALSADGNTA